MFLWRDLDDVAHCRILSPDKTGSLADARYSSIHSCDGTVSTAQTVNGKIGDNNIIDEFSTFYKNIMFLIHLVLMISLHAEWKVGYNKVHTLQMMLTHRSLLSTYCMTALNL